MPLASPECGPALLTLLSGRLWLEAFRQIDRSFPQLSFRTGQFCRSFRPCNILPTSPRSLPTYIVVSPRPPFSTPLRLQSLIVQRFLDIVGDDAADELRPSGCHDSLFGLYPYTPPRVHISGIGQIDVPPRDKVGLEGSPTRTTGRTRSSLGVAHNSTASLPGIFEPPNVGRACRRTPLVPPAGPVAPAS